MIRGENGRTDVIPTSAIEKIEVTDEALVGDGVGRDDWLEVPPDFLYADRSTEELATFLRRARLPYPLAVELGLGPGYGIGGGWPEPPTKFSGCSST